MVTVNTKILTDKLILNKKRKNIKIKEKIAYGFIYLTAILTMLALFSIVGYVLINGLQHVNVEFLHKSHTTWVDKVEFFL